MFLCDSLVIAPLWINQRVARVAAGMENTALRGRFFSCRASHERQAVI